MHLAPLAEGCSHNRASSRLSTGKTGLFSFRSNCPFPPAAKLASMKRKCARLSARATPPAPAAPADSRESVAATAPWPDAEAPGRIDSDSLRDENQTGSNPVKANQSRSNRIKPQKIKKSVHAPRSTSSQALLPSRRNPGQTRANQGKPASEATPLHMSPVGDDVRSLTRPLEPVAAQPKRLRRSSVNGE